MRDSKAAEIFQKYKDGTCTEEEKRLIKKWFLTFGEDRNTFLSETELEAAENAIWSGIQDKLSPGNAVQVRHINWKKYAAAAAVLVFISIALLVTKYTRRDNTSSLVSLRDHDLMPGSQHAVIVYSNGLQRPLSGKVYFAANDSKNASAVTGHPAIQFNTVITPRGGAYHIVLADGTEVWLNAASSLKYPVSFANQNERLVELKGEGYFEVAHNKSLPFKVRTGKQTVEVLGTHFNINGYNDEPYMVTTLMSGSVKLSVPGGETLMKPGEQASVRSVTYAPAVTQVDTVETVAWKNGFFQFRRAGIQDVMRQIARWYDVDIIYTGPVPEKKFTGKVYRNLKLSEALEILTYFNVNFIVKDRTIIINN